MSKMTKEEYYATGKKMDYKQVLHELKTMVMEGKDFSPFEADFIKEVARLATRFKDEFRMSNKQQKIWDELWTKYILPGILKEKTK